MLRELLARNDAAWMLQQVLQHRQRPGPQTDFLLSLPQALRRPVEAKGAKDDLLVWLHT